MERTLEYETIERKKLEAVATLLEVFGENEYRYSVEDTYLDFGQDWMWTTIIRIDPNETGVLSRCQILNPRQWKDIENAQTMGDLHKIALELLKGEER